MREEKRKIMVNDGLRNSPASMTSARANPSAVISACKAALFHSAIATASSSVTPSSSEMPSGIVKPAGFAAVLSLCPVRASTSFDTSAGSRFACARPPAGKRINDKIVAIHFIRVTSSNAQIHDHFNPYGSQLLVMWSHGTTNSLERLAIDCTGGH